MTINDIKTILVNYLNLGGRFNSAVNQEIVDQIIRERERGELTCAEIVAYQIDGTTVFLSDEGLQMPKRVVFVDVKSRNSFLSELGV